MTGQSPLDQKLSGWAQKWFSQALQLSLRTTDVDELGEVFLNVRPLGPGRNGIELYHRAMEGARLIWGRYMGVLYAWG